MPKLRRRFLAMAVLLAILGGVLGGATARSLPVVGIAPAAASLQVGETLAVDVRVDEVAELYGVDIRVAFDPARLQVVEPVITLRTDLLSPPWMVFYNQVDNSAGTIVYVVTMVNPQAPVSGSGAIFSFHFRALAPGSASVIISEQVLSNINGELIPATTAAALYRVGKKVLLPVVAR